MIQILIADDHEMFREGIKRICEDNPDLVVAGEASTGNEVLDKVVESDYDLLLLDIAMPGLNGLDTLKQLKTLKPRLRVLVLSMYPEDEYAMRAIKAGAAGYLTKAKASRELMEAIKKISHGGNYINASVAEKLLFDTKSETSVPLHKTLSDREYQILNMIVRGMKVSEIAEDLSLSVKTVSTYKVRILNKMEMKSTAELVKYALEHDLL
ncbi:MAG: response regulator transcription factor [Nitrospiraceae bacterium]|nr:MAG: response regulator transcription factor [Nitrospiraceae bacterium]